MTDEKVQRVVLNYTFINRSMYSLIVKASSILARDNSSATSINRTKLGSLHKLIKLFYAREWRK